MKSNFARNKSVRNSKQEMKRKDSKHNMPLKNKLNKGLLQKSNSAREQRQKRPVGYKRKTMLLGKKLKLKPPLPQSRKQLHRPSQKRRPLKNKLR